MTRTPGPKYGDREEDRPDTELRDMVEGIADQLCLTAGGRFDHLVNVESRDETVQKLEMIVNFVLATASRSIDEVRQVRDRLERELEERKRIEHENAYLREEVREALAFGDMIGKSPELQRVREQIAIVAPTDASVLILGESGTGKELVAREIHRLSERAEGPMIKVNCAAIADDIFESEFFGHVKGAFTGALRDRAGRFELANNGTLFLDEVTEIPLELQGKLLRVLQDGEFERVGGNRTFRTDVRVIAASNRDLATVLSGKKFREDLFYRLNVFPVEVKPLRERKQDIPVLATHFLERACAELNRPLPVVGPEALADLQSYDWPGNIRELQNIVERAVIATSGPSIQFDLPASIGRRGTPSTQSLSQPERIRTDAEIKEMQRQNILAALEKTRWKVYGSGGAGELLGIKPSTLSARMRKLGINK